MHLDGDPSGDVLQPDGIGGLVHTLTARTRSLDKRFFHVLGANLRKARAIEVVTDEPMKKAN